MIFDYVTTCRAKTEKAFKNALKAYGFTFGNNVTFINYPKDPNPTLSPSHKTVKIIGGIAGGVLGFTAALGAGFYIYRVIKKRKEQSQQNWVPLGRKR